MIIIFAPCIRIAALFKFPDIEVWLLEKVICCHCFNFDITLVCPDAARQYPWCYNYYSAPKLPSPSYF